MSFLEGSSLPFEVRIWKPDLRSNALRRKLPERGCGFAARLCLLRAVNAANHAAGSAILPRFGIPAEGAFFSEKSSDWRDHE